MSRPVGPSIRELSPLTQLKICKFLDVFSETGEDFRTLAANVGMSIPDLDIVAQGKQPTHSVLTWWGRRNEATIPKLREILVSMGRLDCVGVLDKDPKAVKDNDSERETEETISGAGPALLSDKECRKRLHSDETTADQGKRRKKQLKLGELPPLLYKELCDVLNQRMEGKDYVALVDRMKYTTDEDGNDVNKLIGILRKIQLDDLAERVEKECYKEEDTDEESESNKVDVVKLMLDKGADLQITDHFRRSPLHIADKECRKRLHSDESTVNQEKNKEYRKRSHSDESTVNQEKMLRSERENIKKNQVPDVLVREMDSEITKQICLKLDLEQPVRKNDGRMLGEKIGFSQDEVQLYWQGGYGNRSSPTTKMLQQWGTKNHATVRKLREILVEMEREDVTDVIDNKYLQFEGDAETSLRDAEMPSKPKKKKLEEN